MPYCYYKSILFFCKEVENVVMETIIIGLGSNRGDSKTILSEAIKRLASFLSEIRISSIYITKPQDYFDQDDFYNMVVSGNYAGSPALSTSISSFTEVKLLRSIIRRLSSRIQRYTGEPLHSFPCWNCILTIVIPLRNYRSPPHSLPYPIKACEKVSE